MSPKAESTGKDALPLTLDGRLELAKRLFREYHTRCFWHCPRDLVVTADLIPLVASELRKHGGRRGFMLAAILEPQGTAEGAPLACP